MRSVCSLQSDFPNSGAIRSRRRVRLRAEPQHGANDEGADCSFRVARRERRQAQPMGADSGMGQRRCYRHETHQRSRGSRRREPCIPYGFSSRQMHSACERFLRGEVRSPFRLQRRTHQAVPALTCSASCQIASSRRFQSKMLVAWIERSTIASRFYAVWAKKRRTSRESLADAKGG